MQTHRRPENILLVDDNVETLQLFARIISVARPAMRVIRAATGAEGPEEMGRLRALHEQIARLKAGLAAPAS